MCSRRLALRSFFRLRRPFRERRETCSPARTEQNCSQRSSTARRAPRQGPSRPGGAACDELTIAESAGQRARDLLRCVGVGFNRLKKELPMKIGACAAVAISSALLALNDSHAEKMSSARPLLQIVFRSNNDVPINEVSCSLYSDRLVIERKTGELRDVQESRGRWAHRRVCQLDRRGDEGAAQPGRWAGLSRTLPMGRVRARGGKGGSQEDRPQVHRLEDWNQSIGPGEAAHSVHRSPLSPLLPRHARIPILSRARRQSDSSHSRMVLSVRHAATAGSTTPIGRALATAARFISRSTAA